MASTTGLGDDALELVHLLLGTTEGAELGMMLILLFLFRENLRFHRDPRHTLFLASLRARLSRELRSNSITRFS